MKNFNRKHLSRRGSIALLAGAVAANSLPGPLQAQTLTKVRYGFANKSVSSDVLNLVIGQQLGYYREEGLDADFVPLGSTAAVLAEVAAGRIDIALGVPSFQIPLVVSGQQLPAINYFEHTYPFKYGISVTPRSSITALGQLKGKRIGVSSFGTTDYPVGKVILTIAGLDTEKDVTWLAVGEGITAGQALVRGDIDALMYYDTGFGQIEAAGIALRSLPLPPNLPKVGGIYLSASPETLKKRANVAVGFARAVAKAETFIMTNPAAAVYNFIQMFPQAAPQGVSLAEQIRTIEIPLARRSRLYRCYDPAVHQLGYILPSEWVAEIRFVGAQSKVPNPNDFFTNDFAREINRFNVEAIRKQASEFKVPG